MTKHSGNEPPGLAQESLFSTSNRHVSVKSFLCKNAFTDKIAQHETQTKMGLHTLVDKHF